MIVLSDVENHERSKSFQKLIAVDEDVFSEELTVRYEHYPQMEDIIEDGEIETGFELRYFKDEAVEAGFVEDIEDGAIVVSSLEDGTVERIPFGDFQRPILIIDPYQKASVE